MKEGKKVRQKCVTNFSGCCRVILKAGWFSMQDYFYKGQFLKTIQIRKRMTPTKIYNLSFKKWKNLKQIYKNWISIPWHSQWEFRWYFKTFSFQKSHSFESHWRKSFSISYVLTFLQLFHPSLFRSARETFQLFFLNNSVTTVSNFHLVDNLIKSLHLSSRLLQCKNPTQVFSQIFAW